MLFSVQLEVVGGTSPTVLPTLSACWSSWCEGVFFGEFSAPDISYLFFHPLNFAEHVVLQFQSQAEGWAGL